ncbi:TPA: AAA family ATPase [Morganella morganii]|nr:AAA family ATPase [Morganella morganii]
MKINFFNINNFRRLHNVKIDIASEKTIFVGANNSGKTSAVFALKYFLSQDGKRQIKINDITLINHHEINKIGEKWLELSYQEKEISTIDLQEYNQKLISLFPSLDVVFDVPENEVHHVIKIIPSLGGKSGLLGVRLSYEPNDVERLKKEYIEERLKVKDKDIQLWPCDLIDFLSRKMDFYFKINTYLLDISKENGSILKRSSFIIQGFSIHELVKFDFISAQRDISDETERTNDIEKPATQIRRYYDTIINPEKSPNEKDIETLRTLQQAQDAFNKTLESELDDLLTEIKHLGYPNITDPTLEIKTKIGLLSSYLNHPSVLNYKVDTHSLPENYLGLGCQNLISMIVKLIKYRDEWLRIGKAIEKDQYIERLHFVIIEEPEAHLHVQAQQVFINN